MENILLLGKEILMDESKVLLQYAPGEDWLEHWMPMNGHWDCHDGYIWGTEPGNFGGILFSRESYPGNVMFSFTIGAELPATRDLNAVFCANWNKDTDYLGLSYVCGLNGWYEHKSGIEKNAPDATVPLYSTTSLYHYTPGTEVRMTAGAIDGHCFMIADGQLITELIDPDPIRGGHVGFSAYCTQLKIKDIEIREIAWRPRTQLYDPEF